MSLTVKQALFKTRSQGAGRPNSRSHRAAPLKAEQSGGGKSDGSGEKASTQAPATVNRSKDTVLFGGIGTPSEALIYLDGTLPGDSGFDPLELSNPEMKAGFLSPEWLRYAEVIHARWAMLGIVGCLAPEFLGKVGIIPASTGLEWFRTGVIPFAGEYTGFWADPFTLFFVEMALMGFAEMRRLQDWKKPGCLGEESFLGLEDGFKGTGDPAYPGRVFNPANMAQNDQNWKRTAEIKNGRLAMVAMLGVFLQAAFTGVGPIENLQEHVASFGKTNFLTILSSMNL